MFWYFFTPCVYQGHSSCIVSDKCDSCVSVSFLQIVICYYFLVMKSFILKHLCYVNSWPSRYLLLLRVTHNEVFSVNFVTQDFLRIYYMILYMTCLMGLVIDLFRCNYFILHLPQRTLTRHYNLSVWPRGGERGGGGG